MNLDEFLKLSNQAPLSEGGYTPPRPKCVCADGFSISIQAGEYYHSVPDYPAPKYLMVELGFPSEDIEITRDKEIETLTTDEVMSYVPIENVQEMLDEHGGIDEKHMNKQFMMKELTK